MEHPLKNKECCMCGDQGFSHDLFQCKICHFRSQHSYCSNLYPKADSNGVCNWCLRRDETLVSPSKSVEFPCKKRSVEEEGEMKRMECEVMESISRLPQCCLEKTKTMRKRIITKGELEEKMKLRRSRSMAGMKGRNKVRRYKLLREVAA